MLTNSVTIKEYQPIIPELITECQSFHSINIFDGKIGNSKSRSQAQKDIALSQLNIFLNDKLGTNVLVFSDGSAMGKSFGPGGCGVVLVPPYQEDVKVSSKYVGAFTENVECEVEGVVLALTEALNYYREAGIESDSCYVFSDCESAIDILVNQNDIQKWSCALRRAWLLKKHLDELNVTVKLAWVPGHCGIEFNELADQAAKKGCSLSEETVGKIERLSYSTLSKWIDELLKQEWQEKWSRCETGISTKEIIPKVPANINIPHNRNIGISLVRCLLNNAAVANNLFRMKLNDDPDCECGRDRQTVEHILLHCDKFISERLRLKTKIGAIWFNSKKAGNVNFDLKMLLNPWSTKLSSAEAREVAGEFEHFLQNIDFTF